MLVFLKVKDNERNKLITNLSSDYMHGRARESLEFVIGETLFPHVKTLSVHFRVKLGG